MRISRSTVAAALAMAAVAGVGASAQTPPTAFIGQRVVEVRVAAEGRAISDPMIGAGV